MWSGFCCMASQILSPEEPWGQGLGTSHLPAGRTLQVHRLPGQEPSHPPARPHPGGGAHWVPTCCNPSAGQHLLALGSRAQATGLKDSASSCLAHRMPWAELCPQRSRHCHRLVSNHSTALFEHQRHRCCL